MATANEVGDHLDLSGRKIRDLISRGILNQLPDKHLDTDDCRRRYIRHLREMAAARGTDRDQSDLTAERARLAAEQADCYALKNAAARGELIPASDVSRAVVAAFGHVRDRLTALPARYAGQLATLGDAERVRALLDRVIGDTLAELSEARIIGGDDA